MLFFSAQYRNSPNPEAQQNPNANSKKQFNDELQQEIANLNPNHQNYQQQAYNNSSYYSQGSQYGGSGRGYSSQHHQQQQQLQLQQQQQLQQSSESISSKLNNSNLPNYGGHHPGVNSSLSSSANTIGHHQYNNQNFNQTSNLNMVAAGGQQGGMDVGYNPQVNYKKYFCLLKSKMGNLKIWV